jgi:hypothetical protein
VTDRIPLDHLTSDQYDALYRRIETLEHVAAGNKRHVQLIVPELERAEAALTRAHDTIRQYDATVSRIRNIDRAPQQADPDSDTGRAYTHGWQQALNAVHTELVDTPAKP